MANGRNPLASRYRKAQHALELRSSLLWWRGLARENYANAAESYFGTLAEYLTAFGTIPKDEVEYLASVLDILSGEAKIARTLLAPNGARKPKSMAAVDRNFELAFRVDDFRRAGKPLKSNAKGEGAFALVAREYVENLGRSRASKEEGSMGAINEDVVKHAWEKYGSHVKEMREALPQWRAKPV